MIATAKQLPENKALDGVEFRTGLAEDLPYLKDGSVDLIASGTAAVCPRSSLQSARRLVS